MRDPPARDRRCGACRPARARPAPAEAPTTLRSPAIRRPRRPPARRRPPRRPLPPAPPATPAPTRGPRAPPRPLGQRRRPHRRARPRPRPDRPVPWPLAAPCRRRPQPALRRAGGAPLGASPPQLDAFARRTKVGAYGQVQLFVDGESNVTAQLPAGGLLGRAPAERLGPDCRRRPGRGRHARPGCSRRWSRRRPRRARPARRPPDRADRAGKPLARADQLSDRRSPAHRPADRAVGLAGAGGGDLRSGGPGAALPRGGGERPRRDGLLRRGAALGHPRRREQHRHPRRGGGRAGGAG